MFKRYCWPVTRWTSGGKPCRVDGRLNIKELISHARRRICREKGHWARECPNKRKQVPRDDEEEETSFFVYCGGDHNTPCYGKGVFDTRCSRFLIGQNTLDKMSTDAHKKWCLNTQKIKLEKAMTFRFGNDETLETRAMAILPDGIAGVNGALCVHVVPGGAPLSLSKEFWEDLVCHIDLGRGHPFFEKLGQANSRRICPSH